MRSARFCFNLVLAGLWLLASPISRSEDPAPSTPAAENPAKAARAADTKKSSKGKKPKPVKTLRVHVEARRDLPQRSLSARVGRSDPLVYNIEKLPILNEQDVESVSIIDEPDGFQIRVQFDSTSARLLESYTAAAAGRHLIVATEIDGELRWLAAPRISRRIADGILTFSPDATREEMDRMALGLAAAKRKERRNQWIK